MYVKVARKQSKYTLKIDHLNVLVNNNSQNNHNTTSVNKK